MPSGAILSVRDRNRMILLSESLSFISLAQCYAHVFNIVCGTVRVSVSVHVCVCLCVCVSTCVGGLIAGKKEL